MAAEAAGDEAISGSGTKTKRCFLDLPVESQKEIVSHCSQSDLICLALVSKHFHELASAQLYRSFNIIFPDDDDLNFESPIDGLAGGLDTFTTSDYNYAKHLKDLSMDTLSTGAKAEHAYKSYLYSASCGKFLNTLLYLTLKKAKSLESFRWNIRVELSRPVYGELHRMKSLKKLLIRMQAGESYYNTPPPLPVSLDAPAGPIPMANHWTDLPPPPAPVPLSVTPFTVDNYLNTGGSLHALMAPSKQAAKNKASKRGTALKEPATLSGFKNLTTLSVLDIDNLDIVSELKACVKNSSSTLTELHLSLSDYLASQSRKPPPDSDPDDSDVDDEFQVVPASPNTSFDGSGPAKSFRAQEERKLQEGVLGRIFDIEPSIHKKAQIQKNSPDATSTNGKGKETVDAIDEDPREGFVASLKGVSNKLMTLLNGSRDFTASQQEILDVIEKAARKYVDSGDLPASAAEDSTSSGTDSSTVKGGHTELGDGNSEATTPQSSEVDEKIVETTAEEPAEESVEESTAAIGEGSTIKQSNGIGSETELSPEDIDIGHVDDEFDIYEDSDAQLVKDTTEKSYECLVAAIRSGVSDSTTSPKMTPASSDSGPSSRKERPIGNRAAHKMNFESLMSKLSDFHDQADLLGQKIRDMLEVADTDISHVKEAEARLAQLFHWSNDIQYQIRMMEHEMESAKKRLPSSAPTASVEHIQRSIAEYVRDTRGLSLETVRISLIPVKPSVLSRALDLRHIKNLTLLNVGNQAPIWTLLSKENKTHPLALRNVFTDNVSNAFLTCMSQLEELHELFMLERSPKHKPESFAPRSTITIDQIRRLVLKKHMHTLKRLMIKDESSSPVWDMNQKAMILICNRGSQLEELAISMNIHAVHAFMQYFGGLVNLRAINILRFRNNDTCIWVMREILKFMVDNLSHHPELKLEWIAMEDDRIDRIIRPEGTTLTEETSDRGKGKEKVSTQAHGNSSNPIPMLLPTGGWPSDTESEDEEDDAFNNGKRLRLKTVGPLQFYDVWGVKIFEKEIRSGRL